MKSPALEVDKLVSQFDRILSNSGVAPIRSALALNNNSDAEEHPLSRLIAEALSDVALSKLNGKYQQLLELTAEIIANIEDEPYFSGLKIPAIPNLGHTKKNNIKELILYVGNVRAAVQPLIDDELGVRNKNQLVSAIENKKKILNKGFFYEFTDGDLARIQVLINELREQVSSSDLFEEGHRSRLLRRLESLQSEIHKKVSDVDRFWGLIGDAGIAIGKFGKDAKPFVDRVKELSQITWRTQSRAEELPSGAQNPFIEYDGESQDK